MPLLPATPKEVLLSLVNENNTLPVPLTDDQLYLGNPHLDTDGLTTILPTTAQLGGAYQGYSTLEYQRINLTALYDPDSKPLLTSVGGATLFAMLDIVNRFLGTSFTTDDVVDVSVANLQAGETVNIDITATAKSVGYTGDVLIAFKRIHPTFSSVISNRELDVLTYVIDPTLGKISLATTMWNWDFSADTATLAVTGGAWTNLSELQALAAAYGFADWPAPTVGDVADYATGDLPTANPAYQRVAVQKNVAVGDYLGDAYFHYNL